MNVFVQVALAVPAITGCLLIVLWTAGALYYDVGRASRFGWLLVIVWVSAVVASLLFWQPLWQPLLLLLLLFGLFLCWWFSQRASHDRQWQPLTAQLARVTFDSDSGTFADDSFTIENIRNAKYDANGDAASHYETRSYRMSQLRGVDALICFWGSRWMCHPMFVFDFGHDGRVCMSVEVRYRLGQRYSFLRSLYRQQELIYLACDERDAILRRTKYATDQDVYLYRLMMSVDDVREAFAEYAESINHLHASPRWYHGLTSNCTTSVYAQRRNRAAWDWRLLVNGSLDQLFYQRTQLDQALPFETLKQQSWLNEIANSAPRDGFGDDIRQRLRGYCHEGRD